MLQVVPASQKRQLHGSEVDDLNAVPFPACAANVAFREGVTVVAAAIGMTLNHDDPSTHTSHDAPMSTVRARPAASRLQGNWQEAAMRVYEVMSKAVETVRPAVHASEAKTRMRQKKIHHLVVTQGSELQGIVSDRDLGGPKLPKV